MLGRKRKCQMFDIDISPKKQCREFSEYGTANQENYIAKFAKGSNVTEMEVDMQEHNLRMVQIKPETHCSKCAAGLGGHMSHILS